MTFTLGFRKHIFVTLSAAFASSTAAVSVDEVGATDDYEEVVVTALKRKQPAQKVPLSISVVDAASLTEAGIVRPVDLMSMVAGVYAKPTVGNQNPVFTIRGVGFNDFTSIQNPGTALYLDQAPVPYHPMMSFSLFDLERSEVLKGPQGTLYGRNSTAGAIKFISKKPGREGDGKVRLDYSSWGTFDFEGAKDFTIGENLTARVSTSLYERTGGYQTNRRSSDDSYGSQDRIAGRVLLNWTPTPAVSSTETQPTVAACIVVQQLTQQARSTRTVALLYVLVIWTVSV